MRCLLGPEYFKLSKLTPKTNQLISPKIKGDEKYYSTLCLYHNDNFLWELLIASADEKK